MSKFAMFRVAAFFMLAGLTLAGLGTPLAAQSDPIKPEERIWSTGAGFDFDSNRLKKRVSLSGIACPSDLTTSRVCVAVFDEGGEARYVTIGNQALVSDSDPIVLLTGDKELDAEGAAREGPFVYVTGSHSAKRDDCENNRHSRHVFRFGVDPHTGKARPGPKGVPADLVNDNGRLWDLLKRHPVLGKFAGDKKRLGSKPLPDAPGLKGVHGVNIEGLAAKAGWLYFGFREPAKDRKTFILQVWADALFSGGDLKERLFTLKAGPGSGVRDLLAVPEGFLILIGPDDDSDKKVEWRIAFWDGRASDIDLGKAAPLALPTLQEALPSFADPRCVDEFKPEAIALLEDGPDFRRVLVLSDGMCDGGPLAYRISK